MHSNIFSGNNSTLVPYNIYNVNPNSQSISSGKLFSIIMKFLDKNS